MQRIDDPSNIPAPQTPLATVSPGWFRRPSTLAGDQGTIVSADWCNDVQGELADTIEAAGLTLAKGNVSQLAAAIAILAETPIATHNAIQATDTNAGHVEYATAAEVLAQSLFTRVISPVMLKEAFPAVLGDPGYIKIPTTAGVGIVQFGRTLLNNEIDLDVTLPIPFPTAFVAAFASSHLTQTGEADNDAGAEPLSLTTIRLDSGRTNRWINWLAIGY